MAYTKKRRYIGSVRFFTHLLVVVIIFLAPLVISIWSGFKLYKSEQQLEDATITIDEMTTAYEQSLAYYETEEYKIETELRLQQQIEDEKLQEQIALETAVNVPEYQNLYPDLYIDEPIAFVDHEQKYAYLTFDDGPSSTTDSIMSILDQKNCKGTFFILGTQLNQESNVARLKTMAENGHTIGVHTDTHVYADVYESVESFLDDFYAVWLKIYEITGIKADIFRFPGGSVNAYNAEFYQEIISEMTRRGFVYYDWNVSAQDSISSNVPVATILENSKKITGLDYIVLLMHDSAYKSTTVSALPTIIDYYIANGYEIMPLDRSVRPTVFGYKKDY